MIRPVEMQGVIQRVQDVSQIKQNSDNKPSLDQFNIQTQHNKDIIMEHNQVNKKENTDYHNKKFDAKEKGNGEYKDNKDKNNKNKKDDNKDCDVIAKWKGSFDVKI